VAERTGHILENRQILVVLIHELAEDLHGSDAVACEGLRRARRHEGSQRSRLRHRFLLDPPNLAPNPFGLVVRSLGMSPCGIGSSRPGSTTLSVAVRKCRAIAGVGSRACLTGKGSWSSSSPRPLLFERSYHRWPERLLSSRSRETQAKPIQRTRGSALNCGSRFHWGLTPSLSLGLRVSPLLSLQCWATWVCDEVVPNRMRDHRVAVGAPPQVQRALVPSRAPWSRVARPIGPAGTRLGVRHKFPSS